MAYLLLIASQLVSAASDLFADGRAYAAAALARQLVEVEYLAWAFAKRDEDAARWLRSTQAERESLFRPARIRQAAQGRFRGSDYSYHCELGGHPVPRGAATLLNGSPAIHQLMLSDVLGHANEIWRFVVEWAREEGHAHAVASRSPSLERELQTWLASDPLLDLPPPSAQDD